MSFIDTLNITFEEKTPERISATMPITPEVSQPQGFLHGGATITLLETVASFGAGFRCNFDTEIPFGVEANIRHKKPGERGTLHGLATLNSETETRGGRKQVWDVVATDDSGNVISKGTFTTKIVTLKYFAKKQGLKISECVHVPVDEIKAVYECTKNAPSKSN